MGCIHCAPEDDDEATHTERRELLDERQRQAGQIAGLMQEDFGDCASSRTWNAQNSWRCAGNSRDSADCGYQIEQGTSQSVRLRCNSIEFEVVEVRARGWHRPVSNSAAVITAAI